MFHLIKALTELSGPAGQERIVLNKIEELWMEENIKTERTKLGDVLGHVGGQGKRLLLLAHADEICLVVRHIDSDGFLWLANGMAWQRTLSHRVASVWIGQRVRILSDTGEIPGVVATSTGHLATLALPNTAELTWDDFWVDTGLSKTELIDRGITPGTRVIWDIETKKLGQHIVGKALDNRVSLAILTKLISSVDLSKLSYYVTLACTVQEEVALVGASGILAKADFDAAIVLEICPAGDIPGIDIKMSPILLGEGPVLIHKDDFVHYDFSLSKAIEKTANNNNIPLQHTVVGVYGTEGNASMKAGVPTALLAFPTRYTHSGFETAHIEDIQNLLKLLVAFISE